MQPTIYPTNVQKILFKYFIFWDTRKWQTSRSEYISNLQNSSDFIIFVYKVG
jgi:hypothetical protein